MITISYSGLGSYNKCPRQFKYRYIEKVRNEQDSLSPALVRGLAMHQSLEDIINEVPGEVHADLKPQYVDYAHQLKDLGAVAEAKFNFGNSWSLRPFEDIEGWGVRGLLDCHVVQGANAEVQEWKSGKVYDDHSLQRDLYGLSMFLLYPEVDTARVQTVYLDQGTSEETRYSRQQLITYKWVWERKVNKVQPPQDYPMRPGWWCKWCDYSKGKGGTCPN